MDPRLPTHTSVGDVFYSDWKEGNNEVFTIRWLFSDIKNHLNNTAVKELVTPVIADKPASKFQMKMLLLGKYNDLIEMYYLSSTPLELRTEVTWTMYCGFDRKYMGDSKSVDYQIIQGNKWQYLIKICKEELHQVGFYNIGFALKIVVLHSDHRERNHYVHSDKELELKPQTVCEDFANLLADETYSDVTLKSVEGEECRAHKAVLATRSKVMKAHFAHNTTEAITNVIETPFEYEVLRDVLAYIYTDKSLRIDDIPDKVLVAADYYQLSALKSLCEEAICRKLTVENAIETLQLAEFYSANFLKLFTLDFIRKKERK